MRVRALLALGLALLVAPGSASAALNAKQAQRIAAAKLHPPKGAILHALKLKSRSRIVEAGPGPQSPVTRRGSTVIVHPRFKPLRATTWMVWEDLVPGALFEHPSVMLLI